jgi:flagellar basal body-associated protein FliL
MIKKHPFKLSLTMKIYRFLLIFLNLMLVMGTVHAERFTKEEEAKVAQARRLPSVRIYPDVLTNLNSDKLELKYILLRLDLISETSADSNLIRAHMPLVKNQLILFLNKQSKYNFASAKRRLNVKNKMIIILNQVLFPEVNKNLIKQALFHKAMVE